MIEKQQPQNVQHCTMLQYRCKCLNGITAPVQYWQNIVINRLKFSRLYRLHIGSGCRVIII